jgi:uncharacterized protein YrzB (UPF0473 family)
MDMDYELKVNRDGSLSYSDEEEEEQTLIMVDEDGNEVECEVLFTFDCEDTGKSYAVYTDNTEDEDGNTVVYASIVSDDTDELLPIETEEEQEMINELMEDFVNGELE